MKAIDALKKEHEAVRLMMKIMDAACVKINAQQKLQTADIYDMIDFLKVFVDRCHHGKEEQILFPQLELAGVPKEGGPIGVMLAEHEQGRVYIRNMSQAVVDYEVGNAEATALLVKYITDYIELLEQHISKENTMLFSMADKLLSAEMQEKLFDRFETLEEEVIGMGKHEELHKRLERLGTTYLGRSGHGQH